MLAGFAEIEFTPKEGNMPGEIEPFYAKGARTPLMAHAAVFTYEDRSAVLVSMDIIFITTALCDRLRKKISDKLDIPMDHILVACTHTHTGCGTDYQCWLTPAEPEVAEFATEQAFEAVVQAWESRAEAMLGVGRTYDSRFSFCRDFVCDDAVVRFGLSKNVKPLFRASDIDQSINVMRIDTLTGKPRCFIVNYANHLDNHRMRGRNAFCADFAGYLRLALQREYGKDVAVLFLNGCCGDVNDLDSTINQLHMSYRTEGCPPENIGEGLADSIKQLNPRILAFDTAPRIRAKTEFHETARRFVTEEMRAWAQRKQAQIDAGEKLDGHTMELVRQYLAEAPDIKKTVDFGIHIIELGPWVIVGLPGEIYSAIGLRIKANSPYCNTLVVELANGSNGYVASDLALKGGTYEATYSSISYTGFGTTDVIVNGATGMLNEMFDEEIKETIGEIKPNAPHLKG